MSDKKIEKFQIHVLPVKHLVVFPSVIFPLVVEDPQVIELVNDAILGEAKIGLFSEFEGEGGHGEIPKFGTLVDVIKLTPIPDGTIRILLQGIERIKISKFLQQSTALRAEARKIPSELKDTLKCQAQLRNIMGILNQLSGNSPLFSPEVLSALAVIEDPAKFSDFLAANLSLNIKELQELLEEKSVDKRLLQLQEILEREKKIIEITDKLQSKQNVSDKREDRESNLRDQLKAIKTELGEGSDEEDEWEAEVEDLRKQIKKAKMPAEVEKVALKELERLAEMPPVAAEYTISRTYIDWLVALPWSVETEDNIDLEKAYKILDDDHYDLKDVKDRILEFLAVRKLRKDTKGPILCFSGPPGVGKTSLGRSIARAMNRKFVRFSVGGIHDEAEIRGHRRTYIGALPGRVIQMIKDAGTNNPVFMLDEIDKLGTDFRGDPAAALLEALDPEQNTDFVDHYLDVKFDLSKVMFITTANVLYDIPPALRDRMEVIEIPGYISEDKIQIAKKYIVPRQIKENGLKKKNIKFYQTAIEKIILDYTNEAGVRNLEREVANVCRKVARGVAEGKTDPVTIRGNDVYKYLGPPKNLPELAGIKDEVGTATGLAWTPVGGEILFIESSLMKGGKNLNLTGSLGEVMRESAQAALSFIRSNADQYHVDPDFFKENDLHIHVPSGAVPKDGPSAGVTIATSLLSLLLQKPVRYDVAMTGEISLRGRVLPVGGIKEKALAARRVGIKTIILPKRNEKDLEEIPEHLRSKLNFIFVENLTEVFNYAIRDLNENTVALKKGQAGSK